MPDLVGGDAVGAAPGAGLLHRARMLVPRLARLRRRRRHGYSIVVLSTLLIAGSATNTLISLVHNYRQVVADTALGLQATARAVAAETGRELLAIDAGLLGLDRALAADYPGVALDAPAIGVALRQFDARTPTIGRFFILDRDRHVLNAAAGSPPPAPGAVASRAAASALLSVGPARASGGGWSITLSRPLIRGGAVLGYVAAEVSAEKFADFLGAFAGGDAADIVLLRDNGILAATAGKGELGRRPAFAATVLAAAADSPAGILPTPPPGEGGVAMRAYRKLPSQPLIAVVSRDRSEVLRAWYEQCAASLTALLLFAATAGGLTWLVVRALGRRQLASVRQRRSEKRLERQRALLQSTLDNLGEGLSVFNRRGRLVAWNPRFFELLDLPPELGAGASLRDVMMVQARRGDFGPVEPEAEVASRLVQFYRDLPLVKERTTRSGRILQIRRREMPGGDIITIYADVTEFKAFERQIVQARSQAELANRAKSEFLANMSHELRTPLNAIIGFSEIIANQIFGAMKNPKYLEYIGDIHTSSLHLLSIINDVLDMSKIEAGRLELTRELVGAQDIIGEAIRMVHDGARERAIELVAEFPDEPVSIWADTRAVKQIFLNLLSNAIKFSRSGGEVRVRLGVDPDKFAVVEVVDFGIGMSEIEQERALQPFGQAKPAITREYGGTGLGLPITKGLVEAHGGTLTLSSRPGLGTTVRVALPTERTRLSRALQWLHSETARTD